MGAASTGAGAGFGPARRIVRASARALLFVLLVGVCAEGLLQAASLFASHRAGAWRPGAEVRILSVGDSHTFGTNVAEDASYPAQLQRLLDGIAPGRYSVVNLGLPGMSSTQVRRRLAANVLRYQPDLVIVWCGINDYWNGSERDDAEAGWPARLDSRLLHSRLYRLIRVALHDRAMTSSTAALRADGVHQRADREEWVTEGDSAHALWTLHHGGRAETIRTARGGVGEAGDPSERTHREFRAMAVWLRDAGIDPIFVRYPLAGLWPFEPVNRAIERAAREFDVPVLASDAAIARIPAEQQEWKWMSHPSGPMYREIARDLVPLIAQATAASP